MTAILTFSVYAPLASWGEVAVGEVRDSLDRPTRSAVLGLVAAALGIDRADQEAQSAMETGYGVAVHALSTGGVLRDFHTAQSAPASVVKKYAPRTRKQLLEADADAVGTIVSRRTYRQEAIASVAIWARAGARWSLGELQAALARPAYVPYAGRKANSLGLPLEPLVADYASLGDALTAAADRLWDRARQLRLDRLRPKGGWEREVHHDELDAGGPAAGSLTAGRTLVRRDVASHRVRWQFAERRVVVSLMPEAAP